MKITFRQEKCYLCDLSSRHLQQIFVLLKEREANCTGIGEGGKKRTIDLSPSLPPLKAMIISLKTLCTHSLCANTTLKGFQFCSGMWWKYEMKMDFFWGTFSRCCPPETREVLSPLKPWGKCKWSKLWGWIFLMGRKRYARSWKKKPEPTPSQHHSISQNKAAYLQWSNSSPEDSVIKELIAFETTFSGFFVE